MWHTLRVPMIRQALFVEMLQYGDRLFHDCLLSI